MAVALTRSGLEVAGKQLSLRSGSVHYWRLDRSDWRACLEAIAAMGLGLVDVYVPWAVHEIAAGKLDFSGKRDVAAFLRLAGDVGLSAVVRPGPHINAELTCFGVPERVVWDPACQARGARGEAVIVPVPPRMFPAPSYASEAYLDEVTRWFHAVGRELGPLVHPHGPIVLVQVDNEGALYFRDGVFDQDYHPDAIAQYRAFLRERYATLDELRSAYASVHPLAADDTKVDAHELRFTDVEPPRAFAAQRIEDMAYYLDWATFQESMLARALERFGAALTSAGLGGVPTCHNFPPAQEATPLNAARVNASIDLVGYDFYSSASDATRRSIARRASELAVRGDALDVPAFAAELGAGFPPYFPPLTEADSMFTTLCALAYGIRGFNVYMAVERDRWIGAPIDRRGRRRPFAEVWRKLCEALDATNFAHLVRRAPVRILVPRVERRLARLMHAFGPVSAAAMSLGGAGPREACLEDDLGLGFPLAIEAATFQRAMEEALDARGVPWALIGGEDRDTSLAGTRWLVCSTSGGLSASLAAQIRICHAAGARVTLGPRAIVRDGRLRPLGDDPFDGMDHELLASSDPATCDGAVSRAVEALGLARHASDPDSIHVTVHEDADRVGRVVFVINASGEATLARVSMADASWRDVLDGDATTSRDGVLEIHMRPWSVRMLARS